MRIISGNLKGKKILLPKDKLTRPLKDLTKESIFNILKHSKLLNVELENSNILDLFSGVGSFGLECLSGGAKNVTFLENYTEVLNILKKNINNLNQQNQTKIIENDIFSKNTFKILNEKFDIIFMDPPYKEKKLPFLLNAITELKLLNTNGVIIIHRHKKEKDDLPKEFNLILEKSYGISKIIFGNILN
ncbi:16S rRNA (guanine(966)-N(2))-methyltransferase RsmD [Candidatus Pelagibacter giovannonii]|uniref:16S rRNA (Guanine(966)-N(2))-methyltransferase RsmD n=1 Tax=Candidatus Pelagibacter giovannonii TaxID=2563896 RepID=A0A6H1Q4F7_9PROT|nr:16S rRNA (guanine(966)-N(2))-methyltransferase RsmD [Candidatus Pelagibacter giovannonii]QIZ21243.1 16S rRNA (guanine(966)-N(2))-methyltransferase RsmD [Candidatus Pelagibacter giovannonii]